MKKCFLSLALLINVFVSYRSVEALPGMTSQEMQSYFNKNTIVSKLIAAQKYEERYPDFTAKGKCRIFMVSRQYFKEILYHR
jgi:hypothetical protein